MDTPTFDQPHSEAQLLANLAWTRGLARSLVRGSEQAEELVQETWWRVLRNPAPEGVPVRAWISGVMRWTVFDVSRKAKRRECREQVYARQRAADEVDARHGEALLIHADLVQQVEELDGSLRRVVLLRYFDGLSLREIATREGLQISGVRSRLERAHARLRSRLAQHPDRPAGALLLVSQTGSWYAAPAAGSTLVAPALWLAMKALVVAVALAALAWVFTNLTPSSDTDAKALEFASVAPASAAAPAPMNGVAQNKEVTEPAQRVEGAAPQEAPSVVADSPKVAAAPPQDAGLEVFVVDPQGNPLAGVPLLFSPLGSQIGWQGETDAAGRASVSASYIAKKAKGLRPEDYRIGLNALCGPQGVAAINLNDLPKGPVRLVSEAAWGSLSLEFVDPSGRPTDDVRVCSLLARRVLGGMDKVSLSAKGKQSIFRFDFLPLGESMELAGLILPPWTFDDTVVSGPTQAGEHKQLRVTVAATIPTVKGRFVQDAQSTRSLGITVGGRAELIGGAVDPRGMVVMVEDNLSFTARVYSGAEAGDACRYVFELTDYSRPGVSLTASIDGTLPKAGEVHDLGEIPLNELAPRVGGVVKDAGGKPIAMARVRVCAVAEGGSRRFDLGVLTDAEGRFGVTAFPEEAGNGLRISARGYATITTEELSSGELGLEIVLDKELGLQGQLIPCPNLHPQMLAMVLTADGAGPQDRGTRAKVNADWSFTFRGLEDRGYALHVQARQGRPELATVEDLWPVPQGQPADTRLAAIDLRSTVRAFQIAVKASDGGVIDDVFARSGKLYLGGEAGVLVGAIPSDREWLTLVAQGYRAVDLPLADLPNEVTLQPGIPIQLVVPHNWPVGIERSQLQLQLGAPELGLRNEFPSRSMRPFAFDAAGSLRIVVPGPGRYLLLWHGTTPDRKFLDATPYIEGFEQHSIEVEESSDIQVFHLGSR